MNGLELRIEDGGNGKLTLEGYASRTETPYQVGSFTEKHRLPKGWGVIVGKPGPNEMGDTEASGSSSSVAGQQQ
jgi:hypothetical protein